VRHKSFVNFFIYDLAIVVDLRRSFLRKTCDFINRTYNLALIFFQLTIVPTETEYFAVQALTEIPLSKFYNVLAFFANVFSVYFLFPLMVRVSLLFEQHLNALQLLYNEIKMNREMTVVPTE